MEFLCKEVIQLSNDKAALETANRGLVSDNQSISHDLNEARRELTKLEMGRESLFRLKMRRVNSLRRHPWHWPRHWEA